MSSHHDIGKERLIQRLAAARRTRDDRSVIHRRPGAMQRLPLTYQQEALWFIDQLIPGSPTYNVPFGLRLRGPLDAQALQAALLEVTARHEVLRTTFQAPNGIPFQVVGPVTQMSIPVRDLSALPISERETAAANLVSEEAGRPFNIRADLMLRGLLIRLAPDEHILVLTLHHIAADGWSARILVTEMAACYRAHLSHTAALLPDLSVQYADYALFQRDLLTATSRMAPKLEFWRRTLAGLTPLELPADRPRPARPTHAGALEHRQLPADLRSLVEEFARRQRATPFMVLLATFAVLLHRYTGALNIAVGVPTAGRDRLELEQLIGYFVNMVLVRVDVAGESGFGDLVKRVRGAVLDAMEHQDVPFERVVEEVRPVREAGRNPLFQISFTVERTFHDDLDLPGVTVTPTDYLGVTAKFDLDFVVWHSHDKLAVDVEYSTELFDQARIVRMLEHYENLLRAALEGPDTPISQLRFLTDAESQLVASAAAPAAWYPSDRDVIDLIRERGVRTPQALAIQTEQRQVTYRELGAMVDRVASALHERDIGRGLVAVFLPRGVALVNAILGVLAVGAAYVPLGPRLPARRIAALLEQTDPVAIITSPELAAMLPATHAQPVIVIDENPNPECDGDGYGPVRPAQPDALAYVMFTSGSTGQPKGVLITHESLTNFVTQITSLFGIGTGTRVLQLAEPTFDVSVFEIFATLSAGGVLCVAPDDAQTNPERLAQWLDAAAVEVADIPPAVLDRLPPVGSTLRLLSVGGEPFAADLVNRWNMPGRRFLNTYGPTEATVITSWYECRHEHYDSPPPIGWATANHELLLLDRYGNPVPIGVPGELYIGGPGLASGYLGDAQLTADRFVTPPLRDGAATRLYRTGDIGQWRDDGAAMFLGRVDDQIKIHSQRIELGEIEAALREHPSVSQVAVVLQEDPPGRKRLIAFLIGPGGQDDEPALRTRLQDQLPSIMWPAVYVWLTELPLTTSGKVDRRQLAGRGIAPAATHVAPRTHTETTVATIMLELLGVDRLGVQDDFFEMGGGSLMLTQLTANIRKAFGVELAISDVYVSRTAARLATLVDQHRSASATSIDRRTQLVPLAAAGPAEALICMHPSGGSVFCYLKLAEHLRPWATLWGIEAAGLDGNQAPMDTVEAMAADYGAAVDAAHPTGPLRLAGWSFGGVVAYAAASWLMERGRTVEGVALLDTVLPDSGQPPPFSHVAEMFLRDVAALSGSAGPPPNFTAIDASCTDEQVVDTVVSEIVAAGFAPPTSRGELVGRLRVFDANVRALFAHRPEPRHVDLLVLHTAASRPAVARWQELGRGRVESFEVAGDHYSMLGEPQVAEVAERIRGWRP